MLPFHNHRVPSQRESSGTNQRHRQDNALMLGPKDCVSSILSKLQTDSCVTCRMGSTYLAVNFKQLKQPMEIWSKEASLSEDDYFLQSFTFEPNGFIYVVDGTQPTIDEQRRDINAFIWRFGTYKVPILLMVRVAKDCLQTAQKYTCKKSCK